MHDLERLHLFWSYGFLLFHAGREYATNPPRAQVKIVLRLLFFLRNYLIYIPDSCGLTPTDPEKWVWTLPDNEGALKLTKVTDTNVSTLMVWSPDGGRCVSSRPDGAFGLESSGPQLQLTLPDYRGKTVSLPAFGPVSLGYGHGKFTRIGVLPTKKGANLRVGSTEFRYDRYAVIYDNDPATEIAFIPIDKDGKDVSKIWPGVWTQEHSKPVKAMRSAILSIEHGQSVGIYTRPRVWRTFDGVARRPTAAMPTDAEVLASFAKPLDVPVALDDGDQFVDPFEAAQANTLFVQLDAGLQRIRWFGDRAGREYYEGQGFRNVMDGSRCYRWAEGAEWPTITQWGQGNENAMEGAGLYGALVKFPRLMANAKRVGRETIDGVPTTVTKGTLTQLNNAVVKVWTDDRGRVVQFDLPSAMRVSVRYDLPADQKWFAVSDAVKSRLCDDQKGLEVAKRLTDRPAVFEKQDGPRIFRLHEVLAGEDEMRFICYSTQLTPTAAESARFAPYGRNWGRGALSQTGYPDLMPYRSVPFARIDAPDRSIRWYILLPKEQAATEPWRLSINMAPMTPNVIPRLVGTGMMGFDRVELVLPAPTNGQPINLEEYVRRVYADVHSYTSGMPPLADKFAKPATGTIQWFINDVKKDIAKAKAGEFLPYRAN